MNLSEGCGATLKRHVVGLILVVVVSFGSVPTALAHNGSHSVGDFLMKTGGLMVATYNAVRNPVTLVRGGAGMASIGGAITWGQQYGIHAAVYYGKAEYTRATTGNPIMSITSGL